MRHSALLTDYLFGHGYNGAVPVGVGEVILLDLKLPKVDGLEVLKIIRNHDLTRRLPVVILTSSREEQDVAMSYDLKPTATFASPLIFSNLWRL